MEEYRKWAEKLNSLLGKEEFGKFTEFMDNCDDVVFSEALAEIDAEQRPEMYA